MGEFAQYLKLIRVKRIVLSAYNPRANSVVKHGYFSLVSAIVKMMEEGATGWKNILPYTLFTNRTAIRYSYRKSPFYLLYSFNPIIPIKTDILI
jgi:hypothetical protein